MHVVGLYITTIIYYSIFVQFAVVMTNKKINIYIAMLACNMVLIVIRVIRIYSNVMEDVK